MSRLIASSDVTFALGYTPANQTALAGYVLASSLAAVATTGQYGDLLGKPAAFVLSPATASAIGGVKPGAGLAVASDGTLSVTASGTSNYVLPIASVSQLGGVKQGVNVTIASDGTISATGGSSFTLAPATASALGGVKIGSGVTVASDGTISVPASAVSSVAGRTGAVTLAVADISGAAPLASPALSGTPTAPTAAAGTTSTQIATTAFVASAVTASTTGVSSFNTRTGAITLSSTDVTTALTFTPYNATNPAGYQTAAQVTAALPGASTVAPLVDGTATIGTSALYARQDHVHPVDTSRYAATNPSGYQTAAQVSSTVAAATGRNSRIITVAGAVTVTASDYYVGLNKATSATTTVTFEASPVAGTQHVIKDAKGDSDSYPITVVPGVTNGTIDGQPNFVIGGPNALPYGAATFFYNGTEWSLV